MEIITGLRDIAWTMIKGFLTTPGLNILTYSALVIAGLKLCVVVIRNR